MSDEPSDPRMAQFERDCLAAGTTPEAVLRDAGLHRSAWFRWRGGKISPTLRNWDAARSALDLAARRKRAESQRGEAAA